MKGMSIELAKLGVQFCHRTRIISKKKSEGRSMSRLLEPVNLLVRPFADLN